MHTVIYLAGALTLVVFLFKKISEPIEIRHNFKIRVILTSVGILVVEVSISNTGMHLVKDCNFLFLLPSFMRIILTFDF